MRGRGLGFLIILLIIGSLVGSLVGLALGNTWPVLQQNFPLIGFAPVTIDLSILVVTFGFTLQLNVLSSVGFLLAFLLYLKL